MSSVLSRNGIGLLCFMMAMGLGLTAQHRLGYKMLIPSNEVRTFGYHVQTGMGWGNTMNTGIDEVQSVHFTTDYSVSTRLTSKAEPLIGFGVKVAALRGPFRYYAFEVDYLRIRAVEDIVATRVHGSDLAFPESIEQRGTSTQGRLSLRFSPQFLVPLTKNGFLHFGPGLNIQSALHKKERYEVPYLDLERNSPGRGDRFQVDFNLGLATRMGIAGFLDIGYRRALVGMDSSRSPLETVFNQQLRMHWLTLGYHWMSKRADRQCIDHATSPGGARFSPVRKRKLNPW